MRISQKQANLLAKEIVNQLKAKKTQKAPEHLVAKVKQFYEKRRDLYRKEADVREEINRHEATLTKITGFKNIEHLSVDKIISKVEEKAIPTVQQIEDEILLKSMFKSENDMEAFVNSIVKKYEKKIQAKVLAN